MKFLKVLPVFLALLLLPGCATFTLLGIGTAIGIGAVTGVGQFAGKRFAEEAYWRRRENQRRYCILYRHELQQYPQAYRYCRRYWH